MIGQNHRVLLHGDLVGDLMPVFLVLIRVFAPVDGTELEEAQALRLAAGAGAGAPARAGRLNVLN